MYGSSSYRVRSTSAKNSGDPSGAVVCSEPHGSASQYARTRCFWSTDGSVVATDRDSSRDNADVTVVVSCFNYGRYLVEAVESALRQKGGAPRVVVVDDGSTDPGTLDVLERLPPEVEVVRQENRGVCTARNAGLS